MPSPTPPRPRVALRVAIVGHRRDKLPTDADPSVREAIGTVLGIIEAAARAHRDACPELYRPEPPLLTLYTGLAEGADRLAAEAAGLRAAWRVHAVLPFAIGAYERDFEPPDAREAESLLRFRQLLGGAQAITVLDGVPGRYDAYQPLGRAIVDAADLLIAVWDGRDPAGPGGTANVVRRARRDGVPIVRIDPVPDGGAWMEAPGVPDEGRSRALDDLPSRLAGLLSPPEDPEPARRWFAERGGPRRLPRLFDRVVALIGAGSSGGGSRFRPRPPVGVPVDPGAARLDDWRGAWPELPAGITEQAAQRFAPQVGWADDLARLYAARFRGSFTAVYLLAFGAVLVGGLLELELPPGWGVLATAISIAEPVLLAVMLLAVRRGRGAAVHQRWLDYRSLAERTRHLATLWVVARIPPQVRPPTVRVPEDPNRGWIAWLVRARAREAGLVVGALDGEYPAAARRLIRRVEASDQQQFHRRRREQFAPLSEPLEHLAEVLVIVALAFAVLRSIGVPHWLGGLVGGEAVGLEERVWSVLAVVALALPALAAGIHGFLGTADFEGTVVRSAEIEGRLAQLADRLDHLDPLDLDAVGDVALEMTATMEGELGAWHSAAATRRLQAG